MHLIAAEMALRSRLEFSVSDIQDRIVDMLADSFILQRAIDPADVARVLQREWPGIALDELTGTVSRVANGIGVRLKETPDVQPPEALGGACA